MESKQNRIMNLMSQTVSTLINFLLLFHVSTHILPHIPPHIPFIIFITLLSYNLYKLKCAYLSYTILTKK